MRLEWGKVHAPRNHRDIRVPRSKVEKVMSSLLVVGNALRLRPGRDRVAVPPERASRAASTVSAAPPG